MTIFSLYRPSPPLHPHATLRQLVHQFLQFKASAVATRELSPRTYDGYRRACDDLLLILGDDRPAPSLQPVDFGELRHHLAQRLGPRGLGTYVRMIRTLFRWGYINQLIARPIEYGSLFDQPPKRAVRQATTRKSRTFTAEEIRALIHHAGEPLRTFILLGINCGFGQNDIAQLPAHIIPPAIDLGMLSFDRPKTGIARDAVLWPETLDGLRDHACNGDGLAFLTSRGNPWVRNRVHCDAPGGLGGIARVVAIDAIGPQFNKLTEQLNIRERAFYALRRTFRTVADELADAHAAARVMGHEIPGMAGVYVDWIHNDRLQRIADHVREWVGINAADAPGDEPRSKTAPSPRPSSSDA